MPNNFGKAIASGALAGVLWGWVALLVGSLSGIFMLEASFAQSIAVFAMGGAIFGVVATGFIVAGLQLRLFKRVVAGSIVVSFCLWLVLRVGGAALSTMDADRYHVVTYETAQGFVLALCLGVILGLLLRHRENNAAPA
ncbi:MAG: hypothetical protein HY886_06220 [Deltaproteobacteria bacterium]|nr:hypothetical protein [Deltaproteobacteria bacterium]